ncbi:MAG: hypothetical protein JO309_00660 [Pseudonocardiales bacterium]|nr:hypothetical protein [Pseudonocardiales bacterium]MBV9727930.1 hypothetical protein [Pseudonocardiales bacterium]
MIRVTVRAEQPLHLGSQLDAGWLTDTHRFVPGSVLRGALAALWLAEHRPPKPDTSDDVEFQRLFEGGVRFGPLYPSDDALRPLSVFGCKYADDDACRGFTYDAAVDGAARPTCPACGSPVEASKGHIDGVRVVEHTRVELDERERAANCVSPSVCGGTLRIMANGAGYVVPAPVVTAGRLLGRRARARHLVVPWAGRRREKATYRGRSR